MGSGGRRRERSSEAVSPSPGSRLGAFPSAPEGTAAGAARSVGRSARLPSAERLRTSRCLSVRVTVLQRAWLGEVGERVGDIGRGRKGQKNTSERRGWARGVTPEVRGLAAGGGRAVSAAHRAEPPRLGDGNSGGFVCFVLCLGKECLKALFE